MTDETLIKQLFEAAREALKKLEGSKADIIRNLAIELENAGLPIELISEEIIHALEGYASRRYINECLDKKYKKKDTRPSSVDAAKPPDNSIEESTKPMIIDTSGEQVDDETDEQHDTRSENRINDQVKASMNAAAATTTTTTPHDYDQEKGHDFGIKYDYGLAQKEENKIRYELKQDIENLRLELDNARAIIELQRGEIEASKNQKLEARIIDIEELNKNLKVENEQLRHALTKHSFETAKEMEEKTKRADPEEIENLTNYIKNLETINAQRYDTIQELNKKIQSYSNLNHTLEHEPLDLDLTDEGGFLGQFFSYRGRKVKVIHDGIKVTNVSLYKIKDKGVDNK